MENVLGLVALACGLIGGLGALGASVGIGMVGGKFLASGRLPDRRGHRPAVRVRQPLHAGLMGFAAVSGSRTEHCRPGRLMLLLSVGVAASASPLLSTHRKALR